MDDTSMLPAPLAPANGNDDSAPVERCPVIYADRIYLGNAGPRRLRVVCFSVDDRRSLSNNAA